MPSPSGFTIEMYAVTAVDSNSDCSWSFLSFSIVLSTGDNEDTVTTNTEASKCTLALLTYVAVDRHEVFGRVQEDDT
jgi:hypothetical protein